MSESVSSTAMMARRDTDWLEIDAHARERCRQQGLIFTELRATLLRCLWESETPLGAYALTRRLNAHLPKPMASNSVYRILFVLEELGLVRRIASQQTFKVITPKERQDDVLLLCESCGDCRSAAHAGIGQELLEVASAHAFSAAVRVIEVVGTCGSCARGAEAKKRRVQDTIGLLVPTLFLQPMISAGLQLLA